MVENILEDYEYIRQQEMLLLQADLYEEEQQILAEERRKPAIILPVIIEGQHELKTDPLALRRTD